MQLHGPARSVDLYALKKGIKHLEGDGPSHASRSEPLREEGGL